MVIQYYTKKYSKITQGFADSFGGFWSSPDKGHNDPYDAYRHALLGAKLAENFGAVDARIIGDAYEGYSRNDSGEQNMDLWNNDVGINEYQLWKDAVNTGQITDSLEKWIYDAVKQGKAINEPSDTRVFSGPEIQPNTFFEQGVGVVEILGRYYTAGREKGRL